LPRPLPSRCGRSRRHFRARRGARTGRLGPDRHARQPGRRAGGSIASPRCERRSRTLGVPHCRRWRRIPARAGPATGRARRACCPARADRDHGAAARPSARTGYLARRAPAREAGRRPRARLRANGGSAMPS
jgi:hypothetical protein